jgi:hypothetical protein
MQVLSEPKNCDPPVVASDPGAGRASEICKAVRTRLSGSRALMLAGTRNEKARVRIEQELGLAELQWPSLRHHSTSARESAVLIQSGLFRLVIVATGFVDHSISTLRAVCDQQGTLFVQLPAGAGYGTNMLAHHIRLQVGTALGFVRCPKAGVR